MTFFKPRPVYIGKRINLPDVLPDMMQEDNIIVFLAGDKINGLSPEGWVNEHILEPLRPRTIRNKTTGRYK